MARGGAPDPLVVALDLPWLHLTSSSPSRPPSLYSTPSGTRFVRGEAPSWQADRSGDPQVYSRANRGIPFLATSLFALRKHLRSGATVYLISYGS